VFETPRPRVREGVGNTAGVVAMEMLDLSDAGVRLSIEKGVRPSSGMGSSAASAAAAAVGIDEVFGLGYSREDLVGFAAEGERAVAGSAHRDNVAPAILGGFTVVRDGGVVSLEPPEAWFAVALPEVELSTERSREVLPHSVPLGDVVENVSHASTLVAGVASGDAELMGQGMRDVVVEPRRAELVPGFNDVREAALEVGALGVALSGAGPSVAALCREEATAEEVAGAMVEAFEAAGVGAEGFVTEPGSGAEVLG